MSAPAALARILAAVTVTAAPGAAAMSNHGPIVSTGDAVAVAPGEVHNTGGNVTSGTGTHGPAAPAAAPAAVVHTPASAGGAVNARSTASAPRNADEAVAAARAKAAEAHRRALALAEEARRRAAEASSRAQSRADDARSQSHSAESRSQARADEARQQGHGAHGTND